MEILASAKDFIKIGIMSKNVNHVRYKSINSHVFIIYIWVNIWINHLFCIFARGIHVLTPQSLYARIWWGHTSLMARSKVFYSDRVALTHLIQVHPIILAFARLRTQHASLPCNHASPTFARWQRAPSCWKCVPLISINDCSFFWSMPKWTIILIP